MPASLTSPASRASEPKRNLSDKKKYRKVHGESPAEKREKKKKKESSEESGDAPPLRHPRHPRGHHPACWELKLGGVPATIGDAVPAGTDGASAILETVHAASPILGRKFLEHLPTDRLLEPSRLPSQSFVFATKNK